MSKYTDYSFKETTKKFIEMNGFIEPTPIQQQVIPLVCKGKDVIGKSATGTGKTHAFLIPIMERMDTSLDEIQAVITAPTRELALQLYTRAMEMCKADPSLRIRLISGGTDRQKQNATLKIQPHIVIGTPGRIKDLFLTEKTLRVERASILVIDEADMTLEFGFLEDIDAIAGKMRKDLQMLSFSATIPNGLKPFLKKYMDAPVLVENEDDLHQSAPKIEHILVPCKHNSYEDKLIEVLKGISPYICLIFANTRQLAASVAQRMRDEGYDLIELHGDLLSRARKNAMKNIMSLDKTFIVATDIAARGIDIDGVSHVISLGIPSELDFYIHRSGRTGRAGKEGICFTLFNESDEQAIKQLKIRGISFKQKNIKNGEWTDLKPVGEKRQRREDPLTQEISKLMSGKKKVVKPGYKKKRKEEIDKLKRKKHREMIQDDITRQRKERYKAIQIEKRNDDKDR